MHRKCFYTQISYYIIKNLIHPIGGQLTWKILFRRNPKDEEIVELSSLLENLDLVILVDYDDSHRQSLDSSGLFSAKSLNKKLVNSSSSTKVCYLQLCGNQIVAKEQIFFCGSR